MTKRIAVIAILAAAGCDTGKIGDSGDSGAGDCPDGRYNGPVEITEAQVYCIENDTKVRFEAHTNGWTDGGYVFEEDTANTSTGAYDNWSDQHDLTAYDWDACGYYDNVQQELITGRGINDWQENVSTVFQCGYHYGSVVMTYAFAVNDENGNLANCLAFGDNVTALKNGTISRPNDPTFDISICQAGVVTQ
ncbi:MAG: hypothetical protein R3F59_05685 [Myxococcota bacterium]